MKNILLGVAICVILGLFAKFLGTLLPIVGGPVFGIIIGIIIGNLFALPDKANEGIKFTSKKILQWAIIILGGSLSFNEVFTTGVSSIGLMLITISITFLSAFLINKKFKIGFNLTSLISSGTAICGGSAIAAVGPAINADDSEIAYSISVIFLFNVIAALIFPALGHFMQMNFNDFGLWSGTAINDTSSVVAAAFSYSDISGNYAVIVKLTRTLFIVPIAFMFAVLVSYKQRKNNNINENNENPKKSNLLKNFPYFILGFLAMSILNTIDVFGANLSNFFATSGKFMIVVAMVAIGLNTNFKKIKESGAKPILMGFFLWTILSISSLLIINYT